MKGNEMKLVSKSELHIEDGYILDKKDNVLAIDDNIVRLFNELDSELQKALYLQSQPKATPMPTLDGFEEESELSSPIEFHVSTPVLDNRIQESMALMDELDKLKHGKAIEKDLDHYRPIINWADKDKILVVANTYGVDIVVDTPFFKDYGGILKMTPEEIIQVISIINGAEFINDDEAEDGEQE